MVDLINHERIDSVATSDNQRKWIEARNRETELINNALLERYECKIIEKVDNILHVDQQLISDLEILKQKIKRQRKNYIQILESHKLVSEYKSYNDMDIICVNCLKLMFKFKSIKGLNQ